MTYRVLIVDDEPNMVVSLELLMQREGYAVSIARDGQEALDAIRSLHPDLVLLDVIMPVKTGLEVLQTVRADAAMASIKVVLVTAKGRASDVAKGLALGADAYVTKPFSTRALAARVRALLAGSA